MSYRKFVIRAALAMAAGLGFVSSSWAASSAAQNLSVTATVVQTCTLTTSPVVFGNYDPLGIQATNDLLAQGAVTVTCTKGSGSLTAVTVGLGLGLNASGSIRQMKDAGADLLAYELYQPNGTTPAAPCVAAPGPYGTVWGTSLGGLLATTSSTWGVTSPQAFKVCGVIAKGLDPVQATTYSDTVVATVNF